MNWHSIGKTEKLKAAKISRFTVTVIAGSLSTKCRTYSTILIKFNVQSIVRMNFIWDCNPNEQKKYGRKPKLYRIENHLSCSMTKLTKWHVHPAKTQISLGICPVWSESSLSAWRNIGPLTIYWALSEDWLDGADAQADLSLRWAHMSVCWICRAKAHLISVITPIREYVYLNVFNRPLSFRRREQIAI